MIHKFLVTVDDTSNTYRPDSIGEAIAECLEGLCPGMVDDLEQVSVIHVAGNDQSVNHPASQTVHLECPNCKKAMLRVEGLYYCPKAWAGCGLEISIVPPSKE